MRLKLDILGLIIIFGFFSGLGVSLLDMGNSYCENLENNIRENQQFEGSLACYPPDRLEVNLSEKVENSAELKCICRKIDDNGPVYYPVAVSQ